MSSSWSLASALCLNAAATALLLALLPPRLAAAGLMRTNFAGRSVVTACGAILIVGSAPGLAFLALSQPHIRNTATLLGMLLLGFGALGFGDDRWGTPAAKGLRGHVRKLIVDRTITSGLVKAVGGIVVALTAVIVMLRYDPLETVVGAAIIALSANAVNLLDLRPGRASAVSLAAFIICMTALWSKGSLNELASLGAVATSALILYLPDARARLMLGDTGSNALGACVGAALLLTFPHSVARYVCLASLIALHALAERWSLSAIIEASPVLRFLDRLTGVRSCETTRPSRS